MGKAERVKEWLNISPELVHTCNEDGLTPLGYAAYFGHREVVEVLLAGGANVNALSESKIQHIPSNTALYAALAGEKNLEVITLLLAYGAKTDITDITDSSGYTSLHTAAYHMDDPDLIELLLKYGAPIQAKTVDGKTALSLAVERGHGKTAERLMRLGQAK